MNWQPYQPSKQAPWDWRRVVHLHRRAGFGVQSVMADLYDSPNR